MQWAHVRIATKEGIGRKDYQGPALGKIHLLLFDLMVSLNRPSIFTPPNLYKVPPPALKLFV